MERENQTITDLWGNEVFLVPRKRGRPRFEWTQENANKVSMMLAMGWANERIAGCILDPRTGQSVSVKTLQRYFSRELKVRDMQRDRMQLKQLMAISAKAFDGDVSASRELTKLVERNDRGLAAMRIVADAPKEEEAPKLGLKEQRRLSAREKVAGNSNWNEDLVPGNYDA